jgi:chromate transporter
MIPLIQYEVISRRGWLTEQEFIDLLTIAQTAPGPIALNTAVFVGYKFRQYWGALAAVLGVVIPSFAIILVIAMFFAGYQDNPAVISIFKGIRPVVVSLIAVPMINMAKKAKLNIYTGALALATALLIVFVKVSPLYILLVTGVIFVTATTWRRKTK